MQKFTYHSLYIYRYRRF